MPNIPHVSGDRLNYVILVRLSANHLETNEYRSFYYGSDVILVGPGIQADARLATSPTFSEYLFGDDGRPLGYSTPAVGQFTLDNFDGELDVLRDFEWGLGTFEVRIGLRTFRAYSDFTVVWSGRVLDLIPVNGGKTLQIEIAEQATNSEERTIPQERFGATYSGFNVSDELVGTPIPFAWGLLSSRAPLLDPNHLVFHLGGNSIWKLESATEWANPDNPQSLEVDPPIEDPQDFYDVVVQPGHVVCCPSLALVKVGLYLSNSDIKFVWITHEFIGGSDWACTARVIELLAGYVDITFDTASLAAHRALWPEEITLWFESEITIWQLINDLCAATFTVLRRNDDGTVSLLPIPMLPSAYPDHSMVFGDLSVEHPRHSSDLGQSVNIRPFRSARVQPVVMGHRVESQPPMIEQVNLSVPGRYRFDDSEPIPAFFRGDFERLVSLLVEYLGTAWRLWTVTTEWRGEDWRPGETIAVTDESRGLVERPMLVGGVRKMLKIPSGKTLKHVLPVTLLLIEVRDGR